MSDEFIKRLRAIKIDDLGDVYQPDLLRNISEGKIVVDFPEPDRVEPQAGRSFDP